MYRKLLVNSEEDIQALKNTNIDKSLLHVKVSYPFNKDITDDYVGELKGVHSINLHYCKQMTDNGLVTLGTPEALDISRCKQLTNKGLIQLVTNISKAGKRLRVLNISNNVKITNKGISVLGKFEKLGLTELHISGNSEVSDDTIKLIARNNVIRIINLSKCKHITSTSLTELKHLNVGIFSKCQGLTDHAFVMFNNLTKLNISNCKNITDSGINLICNNRNLEELILSSCKQITNEAFISIKKLKKLKILNIDYCHNITDTGILQLHTIENISLVGCKITDESIKHLSTITTITSLNIYGQSTLTLESLVNFTNLVTLDASMCNFPDNDTMQFTNLNKLFLSGCVNIKDYTLGQINNLTQLDLTLCNYITTQCIIKILQTNPIENIILNWVNNVTDDCLQYMNNATYISLLGCVNITDKGIEFLSAKLLELQNNFLNESKINSVSKNLAALENNIPTSENNFTILKDPIVSTTNATFCMRDDYYFFGQKNRTHTLQYLDISHCLQITDEAIRHLSPISILCLKMNNNNNLTDVALSYLNSIHTLAISNCPKIVGHGLANLKGLHTLNITGNEFDESVVSSLSTVHKLLV